VRGTWQTTDSGGGLVLVVIVALVLIGSGAASAAASALASLVVTIAIVLGSVTVLAVLGAVAWLVYRARQDRPGTPIAARLVSQLPSEPRPQLEVPHNRAIEPPRNELHLHFHGMSPDEAAEAIRRASGSG
jgi:hypothetical protein